MKVRRRLCVRSHALHVLPSGLTLTGDDNGRPCGRASAHGRPSVPELVGELPASSSGTDFLGTLSRDSARPRHFASSESAPPVSGSLAAGCRPGLAPGRYSVVLE